MGQSMCKVSAVVKCCLRAENVKFCVCLQHSSWNVQGELRFERGDDVVGP